MQTFLINIMWKKKSSPKGMQATNESKVNMPCIREIYGQPTASKAMATNSEGL